MGWDKSGILIEVAGQEDPVKGPSHKWDESGNLIEVVGQADPLKGPRLIRSICLTINSINR